MPYLTSDGIVVGHFSMAAKKKCYNTVESYGEICVGCRCCATDKRIRYEARLALHERELVRLRNFDQWFFDDPDLFALQRKNVAASINYNEKKRDMYNRKLERLKTALYERRGDD